MSLDADLLALLRCPEDHSTLSEASEAELSVLNAALAGGELKLHDGSVARGPLSGALIRADRARAYAVVDEIPNMLPEEGIVLPEGLLPA